VQSRLKRLHFVGIGGIGMAALAELLHARGFEITGSDLKASPTTRRLRDLGLRVEIGHDADLLGEAQAVVFSSAIPADNPELAAARRRGLPLVGRGDLLAEVMRPMRGIAIAGSHGKTTTTAMTAHLLEVAGLEPTALVGGRVPQPGGFSSPTKLGQGDWLVAEVDESDGSFLSTRPVLAVVTNIDPEHLDYYGERETLLEAFLLGIDHPGVAEILPRIHARTIGFGFSEQAELRIEGIETSRRGQRFRARLPGDRPFDFELPMPGRHNVLNAMAAIGIGLELEIDPACLAKGLASYPGVARRFERKGARGGIEVVDDYAHHPAELRAVLAAARSVHDGALTAVFQPHRYTRTRDCWDEFLHAFEAADRVVLADVYAAGEPAIEGVDAAALAAAIRAAGHPDVRHGGSLADIARELPPRLRAGELVLTLGAGDVVELGPALLAGLASGREGAT